MSDIFGNFVGAVSNIWSGNRAEKSAAADRQVSIDQFNSQMDETLQRRVRDGLKAGINPLAAIGASANVSPTIHAGGSDGGAGYFSRAGDYLSRLFQRKQEDDIAYDNEAKELDLEGKRLENRILRNRAQESEQNLASTSKTGSAKEVPSIEPSRRGEKALFVPVYDLHGHPRLVANQDVVEGDNDNAGYRASILTAIANGDIDKKTGEIKNPETRKMLDQMYYDMTGHHIKNLEQLYLSPTEMGLVTKDEARDIFNGVVKFFSHRQGY